MVSVENPVYHSAGNCLIQTENKILIAGCKNSIIPTDGSVTSIGDYAFHGCSSLVSIMIPDAVTNIGRLAFEGCDNLTSVALLNPEISVGMGAFGSMGGGEVYFAGTLNKWKSICQGPNNYNLTLVTCYYYSDTNPNGGNYWHYVDGVPTKW